MPAPQFFDTVRITKTTRMRAQNLLNVLMLFKQNASLTLNELYAQLNCSPSAARNYIIALMRHAIVIIKPHMVKHESSHAEYVLTENTALLQQFETAMKDHIAAKIVNMNHESKVEEEVTLPMQPLNIRGALTPYERYPDRQFHLLADDVHVAPRMVPNKGEGKRDPLVSALFGPAKRTRNLVIDVG